VSIRDTLKQFNYQLIDSNDDGEVWASEHSRFKTYVSLAVSDGIIQAVKAPDDDDETTTVIHFNRNCEELTDLLGKWSSDVTPAVNN
jgi:hypothetical protein